MFEDFLVAHNPHWSGEFPEASTKRLCFPKLLQYIDTKQVIAITGVRRAGKSTLVKQLLCHLIEKKHIPPHNILFINLEHPYLSPYKEDVSMLQRIYEDYIKIT
ncbi:MAG: ATP-binding protein, partial [Chlamydiae bacterium]|nr:ATP-binding protein [Chlamydiota bacterium]